MKKVVAVVGEEVGPLPEVVQMLAGGNEVVEEVVLLTQLIPMLGLAEEKLRIQLN